MKGTFDFLGAEGTGAKVGQIAFSITIIFASMALVGAALGVLTGCCVERKCQRCCAILVSLFTLGIESNLFIVLCSVNRLGRCFLDLRYHFLGHWK